MRETSSENSLAKGEGWGEGEGDQTPKKFAAGIGGEPGGRGYRVRLHGVVTYANDGWTALLISLGVLGALGLAAIGCAIVLRKRVGRQTQQLRDRLEHKTSLERRYRDLVDNATDIVYTHGLQGNITSFNPAGERITGYSPEEAVRINISQLVAPDQVALAREMTARKIRGDPVTVYELDLITKRGRRVTVEISSRPILENGKVVGVQGFARDVTERKRAQRILQQSEERKKAILESALDCIITIDPDGRIVEFNPASEKTFGYSRDQVLGRPLTALLALGGIRRPSRERTSQDLP